MATIGVETIEGNQIKFADMDDAHLCNWVFHAEQYLPTHYGDNFRKQLRDEAKRRGISDEALEKADGSFITKDGVHVKYNWACGKYTEVQE